MKEIKGVIEIEAPVGKVWQVVTDFGSYPEWNPWIASMVGDFKVGGKMKGKVKTPGKKDMSISSVVVKLEKDREILLRTTEIRGLLGDTHRFTFEKMGENRTKFFQSVVFHGILSPFIGGMLAEGQKSMDLMNEATKKRCEGRK